MAWCINISVYAIFMQKHTGWRQEKRGERLHFYLYKKKKKGYLNCDLYEGVLENAHGKGWNAVWRPGNSKTNFDWLTERRWREGYRGSKAEIKMGRTNWMNIDGVNFIPTSSAIFAKDFQSYYWFVISHSRWQC